ncbi:hypothetical protein K492DRAFT_160574 [Lichtheimia hyalospora FSU 10163]|nr:hypothetical protein K492DRAFT_160574 [Lichtheimia hyalospora FSU 10163]
MHWNLWFAIAATAGQVANALTASTIGDCPSLAPRSSSPTSIHDLRPDDIKVVGALGDSIMAGFALMGIDEEGSGILNISAITEYRGHSWAIGGDNGAVTMANFVKRYSSSLQGPSVGSHLAEICNGLFCLDFISKYRTMGLVTAHSMKNINFNDDWKMITIQIGSNDQCASCLSPWKSEVTAEKFGSYVEKAVERIQKSIPRTIVNLVGSFKVSPVYTITRGQDYCRPILNIPDAQLNRVECSCFLGTNEDRGNMDDLADSYNVKLQGIYEKYKAQDNDTFAVTYQPADINIAGFPIEALSEITHQWVAKKLWGDLFVPRSNKTGTWEFDENQSIYCPTEDDRIRLD